MLARAHTFTIDGLQTRHVTVEVDVRAGLPAFTIVGLADAAVREARERVRAAILNSGFEFPARRITANLAPGDVPKAGAALDLALACAVLAASGQLPRERLDGVTCCSASSRSTARCAPVAARSRSPRQRASARPRHAGPRRRPARARHSSSRASTWPPPSGCEAPCACSAAAPADALPRLRALRALQRVLPATGPGRCARPASRGARARDRGGGRAQLPAERPAGNGQDDARPAPRLDPAAAQPRGGDRGDADTQHRRAAPRVSSSRARPWRAPHHSITMAGSDRRGPARLGRRGGARPQRRAVPGRALGVRAARCSRRCASRWRTAAWRSSARGTRRSTRRASCCSRRPTRAPAATPASATFVAAAKPSSRAIDGA